MNRFFLAGSKKAFNKALFFLLLHMVLPARIRILLASFYIALVTVLFFLPGSALPKANWLSKVYFDKWVHIGFFLVLLLVWLWALTPARRGMVLLLAAAVGYGLLVEVIQDQFIVNRSFDLGDWLADITGSFAGLWFWNRYIKK